MKKIYGYIIGGIGIFFIAYIFIGNTVLPFNSFILYDALPSLIIMSILGVIYSRLRKDDTEIN